MANENNVRDQLGVSATIGGTDNPVFTILNALLGSVWRDCAQHQTHVALIEAWEKLGESLYCASRLPAGTARAA
jgi:hypothetical protein